MFEADSSSSGVSSTSQQIDKDKNIPSSTTSGAGEVQTHDGSTGTKESCEEQEQRPEQSNKLSSTGTEDTNKKANQAKKICGVCGDLAKSFHFGGLSCDSCKAFFRRAVHNESNAGFRCAYDGHCNVDKGSRKGCQFCRFKKCLVIGMETKWVMGEDERNQLKQQKKEKKPDVVSDKEYEPDISAMLNYMTAAEKDEIECIVNKYQHSYREIPFRVSHCQGSRSSIEIIQMFTTILRRFAYFTKLLPEFTQLSIPDQSTLLRASVLEMCLLRGALSFDMKHNRWPESEKLTFLKDCPQLRVEDMEKLVSKDLYDMHMQFITGIKELGADEPTVMILLLVVLFYPERGTLENQQYISQVQEKYLLLLKKYVEWRYGPKGAKTFPKLLTKLADLRQLNDSHTEYNLKMSKTEVERIQEQLGNLNLNPYPQWVLVEDQNAHDQHQDPHPQVYQFTPQAKYPQGPQVPQGYQTHAAYPSQPQPQPGPPPASAAPQPRDFFMQFVNRKIPALVNNPFTQFPIENELAYARSFFQQNPQFAPQAPQGHFPGSVQGYSTSPESMDMNMMGGQMPSHAHNPEGNSSGGNMSQFKNILEATDQNSLRQLKESLSPSVLAKLQVVFGGDQGQLDMNRIPPEVMNFIAQQQNQNNQQAGSVHPQQYAAHLGMMGGGAGSSIPGGFQEPNHPMSQYSQLQLTDHFTNLQQQFRNPNYYYENQEIYGHYPQQNPVPPPNDYAHQQQQHMLQQPPQYQNW